jgi:hypothetical protein
MSWCSKRSRVAGLALLVAAAPAAARAQSVRESQVQVLGIASRPLFGGAGVALAWRDASRTRWQVAATLGGLDGHGLAGRLDVAYHFLLDPAKRRGSAVYGGAGISTLAGNGRVTPYVLVVLGAENAPGGNGGSFVEVGVGGGVRFAFGYRWRKRNAPGR